MSNNFPKTENFMHRSNRLLSLLALTLPTSAAAATWPSTSDWEPVTAGGSTLTDPCGDVSGSDWWDMIGDADHPVMRIDNIE